MKHTSFYPADILLPAKENMEKWAVVACDQFTSQPEYWEETANIVGDANSTLKMILPEVYLEEEDVDERIENINTTMKNYLEEDVFTCYENSMIYIERTQSDGRVRHGIIGKIDLECYEFTPGNTAEIRATEGTVLSRIPPRVKVRENAEIEFPHVMLLIDDPDGRVIKPLAEAVSGETTVYDFDLMQGGGHIKGWILDEAICNQIEDSLQTLNTPEEMERKYGMGKVAPMLFAVGDGNHSLATAKRCYENAKKNCAPEDWDKLPCRYALVEVVNIHDEALEFEPIHRVVFNEQPVCVLNGFKNYIKGSYEGEEKKSILSGLSKTKSQVIRYAYKGQQGTLIVPKPRKQLAVGTLQEEFLDGYIEQVRMSMRYVPEEAEIELDYIHGDETAIELGSKDNCIAFLLPPMEKSQLFKTVIADGVLPRKTFSMGHAQDKRYYLEGRKIK